MNDDINVCSILISNPNKIVNKNIKKIEIVKYYEKYADFLLKFIKNRPISEIRCHNGFECFFKKHPANSTKLIYVKTKKDLILEVQQGTFEFHPYGAKSENLNKPDTMIFDLDPDEKLEHDKLVEAVLILKNVLDKLKLKSFLKTSGGKGYHVVIPFKNTKNWKTFETFAKNIALLLESTYPKIFTTNIRKKERKGKIFVDYLRNKKGSTCVAPFSLRARDNLPVSLPILWKDIYTIKPNQVNIKNIDSYINPNAWKNYFKVKNNLSK